MGIKGSKKNLRKSGGVPKAWYRVSNARWEERTSQSSGEDYFCFAFDGLTDESDEPVDVMFYLSKSAKAGEYVRIEDGALKSVDDDDEYEIPERSGVGRFFSSLSDVGVSDKIMDNIGDNPGGLDGVVLFIDQEPVLDADGEPKRNDAGYAMTNTIATKLGKGKEVKATAAKGSGKKKAVAKAAVKGKGKKAAKDDDDEDEDEEEDEDDEDVEESDDEDEDDDDSDDDDDDDDDDEDEDEEEEEPAPKRGRGRPAGSKNKAGKR